MTPIIAHRLELHYHIRRLTPRQGHELLIRYRYQMKNKLPNQIQLGFGVVGLHSQ